jgi:hypothetical protein
MSLLVTSFWISRFGRGGVLIKSFMKLTEWSEIRVDLFNKDMYLSQTGLNLSFLNAYS